MRKKHFFVLLIVFSLLNIVSISFALSVKADTSDIPTMEEFLAERSNGEPVGIDGTHRFESMVIENPIIDKGNTWTVQVIDDFTGEIYLQDFECVVSGTYGNIWIGLNDTVWDGGFVDRHEVNGAGIEDDVWYFAYPWSSVGANATEWGAPDPDGDGYYLPPGYMDWITGEDLLYIMDEFDNNIHDKVVDTFASYAPRPGPLDDYKVQILIFNMRDGLFHDPINAGWFIAGYFWWYASYVNDANIFHMDSYQWWRRVGEPTTTYYGLGPLPLQYEGTFAHEFQHLVHDDADWNEYSWVNEGCSTLAEYICGYGVPYGHIGEYFLYYWDTSLVLWGTSTFSGLSHYGVSFLWTYYMYEHYGGEGSTLIWDIVHEQANGIAGWNNVIDLHGIGKTFDEIFQDWSIANYIDDTSLGDGEYGYEGLNFPEDSDGITLPMMVYLWNEWNPWLDTYVDNKYPNEGYAYPFASSLPYTPNYVEFHKTGVSLVELNFDGDDYCGVLAQSGMYKWFSPGDAFAWFRLGNTFAIPLEGATLRFWNYFDIEELWDFGYVEVHDLDTDEWYTLSSDATVDTVGYNYGTDNPYCPDDLEPTAYADAGRWNAFTGSSNGWYLEHTGLILIHLDKDGILMTLKFPKLVLLMMLKRIWAVGL
ncbi:MAG: hypothetical protein ACXAAH_13810 [Promethearchaeota archaeon]|jgi:hypothetical protein